MTIPLVDSNAPGKSPNLARVEEKKQRAKVMATRRLIEAAWPHFVEAMPTSLGLLDFIAYQLLSRQSESRFNFHVKFACASTNSKRELLARRMLYNAVPCTMYGTRSEPETIKQIEKLSAGMNIKLPRNWYAAPIIPVTARAAKASKR